MADNVKVNISERNGVDLDFQEEYELIAENIPFDETVTGEIAATDVQGAIDEISNTVATSASPGFSFGRASNVSSGTWLQCEGVPSNKAGRFVYISNPILKRLFISNERIATFSIEIYEHDGDSINLNLLTTQTITNARGGDFALNISITSGRQLALKVSSGSARNVVAGLELAGSN